MQLFEVKKEFKGREGAFTVSYDSVKSTNVELLCFQLPHFPA